MAEIRVTKPGYEPHVQTLSLSDHSARNFTLTLSTPRPDLAGTYTLTLSAGADCRDKLPEEVWTRRFTATVRQTGPVLDVSLTGSTFLIDASGKGDRFRGRIEPGRVLFTLLGDYYYRVWPDILEEIRPSLYFGAYGFASAAVSPGNISGDLNGTFFTMETDPRRTFPMPSRSCYSGAHQLVLQR